MEAKEKAEELVNRYLQVYHGRVKVAKQCALICVDEILKSLDEYDYNTEKHLKDEFGANYFSCEQQNMESDWRYWNKVKTELEKL